MGICVFLRQTAFCWLFACVCVSERCWCQCGFLYSFVGQIIVVYGVHWVLIYLMGPAVQGMELLHR
jgi:hypothetical protein